MRNITHVYDRILIFIETYHRDLHTCSLILVDAISEKAESKFRVRAQILDHQLSFLNSFYCNQLLLIS